MTDTPEHLKGAMVIDPATALQHLSSVAPVTAGLNAEVLAALASLHAAHLEDNIEIDDAGWMHGRDVHQIPTVRTQKLATPGAEGERHVEGVVWHYTDTRNAGAVNLAKRIAAAGQARSCHLWIDRAGVVAQSASFERGTWHAGSSTAALFRRDERTDDQPWQMLTPAQRGNVRGYGANSFAAGIELENVGEVRLVGGQWLGWPFRHDLQGSDGAMVRPVVVPADEVASNGSHGWHAYTHAQASAAKRVVSALVRRYGLKRAACEWTHQRIDPTRRTDPGPLWTDGLLPSILADVFG